MKITTSYFGKALFLSTLLLAGALAHGKTITFDDLSPGASANGWITISNGYESLTWSGFGVLNGSVRPTTEGYRVGTVSTPNVAFNLYGDPASFGCTSPFDVHSAFVTAAFVTGLQVRVLGYSGANVVYDNTFTVSPSAATLLQLDYLGVDRVSFISSPSSQFALDNLDVTLPDCIYTISPTSLTLGSMSATGTVSVLAPADCAWNVVTSNAWITIVSGESGAGNGTVIYSVAGNTGNTTTRTGTIVIAGQNFTLTQSGSNTNGSNICTYSLSPTSRIHGSAAATNTVAVTTQSGCAWNVFNTNAWITIVSGISNVGSGTVRYSVAANNNPSSRSGNIRIDGKNFLVTQLSNTNTSNVCTFALSPTSATHSAVASTGTVAVTTQSGCAWNVFNTNAWITIVSGISNVGSGTVMYSVAANNNPSSRSGNIRIDGQLFAISQSASYTNIIGPTGGFDAARDFGTNSNPNGVWAYGWESELAGPLNLFPNTRQAFSPNGMPYDIWEGELTLPNVMHYPWTNPEPGINGTSTLPPGTLLLDPPQEFDPNDKNYTVVRFTAPSNGWYRLETAVAPCYDGEPQGDTDFQVMKNGGELVLVARYLAPPDHFSYATTLLLDGGDTIDFAVGRGADEMEYGSILKLTAILTPTNAPVACTYAISPTSRTLGSASATGTVAVTTQSGCAWNVFNTNGWITIVSGISNAGSGTVIYAVAANNGALARSGNIHIDGQNFLVTQTGNTNGSTECTFALSPTSRTHSSAASTGGVDVATQSGCAWNVFNSNAWVTILSSLSNSGSGQVIYSVSENTTPVPRSGNIRIDGQLFSISQSAAPAQPITMAEALDTGSSLVWDPSLGSQWFGQSAVTHDGVDALQNANSGGASDFSTTVTGPGTLSFWWKISAGSNSDFLSLFINGADQGVRISGETDWEQRTVTVPAGTQTLIWYYAHFGGPGTHLGWVDQVQYVPTVTTGNCTYAISPASRTHTSASATGTVSVTTQTGCAWNVFNPNGWITIVSGISNAGNGTVIYSVAANNSALTRSGNIHIDSQNFLVTQLGNTNGSGVCTFALTPTSAFYGTASATGTVAVTTQAGCAWSVSETNAWISILSSLSNSNSGTVVYFVAPNTNAQPRTAYIHIDGQNFVVRQEGTSTNILKLHFIGRIATGSSLSVEGETGRMYVVECSEDLIHWTPISTNSSPSAVTDTALPDAPRRFYRTYEVP